MQNEQPTQPPLPGTQPSTPPVFNSEQQPQYTNEDAGQALGIVAIVLNFIFLAPVSIVLGIIARKKSIQSGYPGTSGLIGMILGIVFSVIGGLVLVLLMLVSFAAYGGIQDRAKISQLKSYTNQIEKHAEKYYLENGAYPDNITVIKQYAPNTYSADNSIDIVDGKPSNGHQIGYNKCETSSAQIYTIINNTVEITPLGNASSATVCNESLL